MEQWQFIWKHLANTDTNGVRDGAQAALSSNSALAVSWLLNVWNFTSLSLIYKGHNRGCRGGKGKTTCRG